MIKRLTCLIFGHTPASMLQLREHCLWHCSSCGVYYNDDSKYSGTSNTKGDRL